MIFQGINVSGSMNVTGSFIVPKGATVPDTGSAAYGDLFFDTTADALKIFTSASGWQLAGTASSAAGASGVGDIEYLLVAGGGGGGGRHGGGGGAGGYISSSLSSVTSGSSFTITVGAAGSAGANTSGNGGPGGDGGDSSIAGATIATLSATGGGGGATYDVLQAAGDGGSGGGGATVYASGGGVGGSGTAGQGNDGGDGSASGYYNHGGGGGASAAGTTGTTTVAGNGGDGKASSITGTSTTYAGGGGGGGHNPAPSSGGSGGAGGGGASGTHGSDTPGNPGTTNTGGGGGGATTSSGGTSAGGAGGSGVVILAYDSGSLNCAGGIQGDTGTGRKYHQFNASDTFKVGGTSDFQIVTDSLTVHLDAGNFASRGTSTWTDLTGNSYNASMTGTDLGSNYYYTYGSGDYGTITYNSNIQLSLGSSVEIWIKHANTSGGQLPLWMRNVGGICIGNVINANNVGYWTFAKYTTTWIDVKSSTAVNTTWHHIVGVVETSAIKIYVDGALEGTTSNSDAVTTAYTYDQNVGGYQPDTATYSYYGDIGQYRMYNKALSASEVLQNYNATKTNFV